ncbi:exodeoxyribonuclease V alpha subunit [Bathymodiolus japonicus methanotrophic gill symbiont]|uniref:exodeoxyribonuclease V subunit alpha n=1 Tax=Bathymodiolus japonicus methanotrophic gill symbiont TaxID=113269 RepID=UPI001B76014E|nr:exodeoxyribonuclease V subunit alpha [Bathymodiolus japonicus methanotrophic gill symbiont]GFO72202.1 exodeoxyribonuclease V alpha subunit [Bathymodiolus japonicus methanotrophic gill symbiont]
MQDETLSSRLDYAFARFLTQLSVLDSEQSKQFKAIIAQLSYAQSQGHSCIELSETDQKIVLASGMADESGKHPLVMENNRLYLQRYWSYECQLADKIITLSSGNSLSTELENIIEQYFPNNADDIDWQKKAALRAVQYPFTIITGGPGTGKTTTVVKILALLQELSPQPLNIALAAPTGKAAMRLQESIGQSKKSLPCSELIKQVIPDQVSTLHRLLGARPASPYFKYNIDNPLPFDIVVIDEVSMIDLALMSKLVSALKQGNRLILLGDKDQLASVETGAVLADLTFALPEYTQELKKSYRFSGYIKTFSDAVNQRREQDAWELLAQDTAQLCLLKQDLIDYISHHQTAYLQLITEGAEYKHCFSAFNEFQVLCATRQGVNSVADINHRVVQQLRARKLIKSSGEWYSGRPVMIAHNDPALRLYNGDIGVCMPDTECGGQLMVFFLMPDGAVKKYVPARLPYCETVYAMTIHKSQGSEFNEVLLVLPESINPVLTKELIYTGITRAKESLKILANKEVFLATLQRKVERSGGLAQRIMQMK